MERAATPALIKRLDALPKSARASLRELRNLQYELTQEGGVPEYLRSSLAAAEQHLAAAVEELDGCAQMAKARA